MGYQIGLNSIGLLQDSLRHYRPPHGSRCRCMLSTTQGLTWAHAINIALLFSGHCIPVPPCTQASNAIKESCSTDSQFPAWQTCNLKVLVQAHNQEDLQTHLTQLLMRPTHTCNFRHMCALKSPVIACSHTNTLNDALRSAFWPQPPACHCHIQHLLGGTNQSLEVKAAHQLS